MSDHRVTDLGTLQAVISTKGKAHLSNPATFTLTLCGLSVGVGWHTEPDAASVCFGCLSAQNHAVILLNREGEWDPANWRLAAGATLAAARYAETRSLSTSTDNPTKDQP